MLNDTSTVEQFDGKYRFLSNFYPCIIRYEGLEFQCVEGAYQAAKCVDENDKIKFMHLNGAGSKRLGREIAIREDWHHIKISVMRSLIQEKFADGSMLAKRLLETGDDILVEGNYWNDTFWGVCKGKGKNVLGKLLMERRWRLWQSITPTDG